VEVSSSVIIIWLQSLMEEMNGRGWPKHLNAERRHLPSLAIAMCGAGIVMRAYSKSAFFSDVRWMLHTLS